MLQNRSFLLISIFLISLLSCAGPVVERNYRGSRNNYSEYRKKFISVIKKKVVILPFFNESPFRAHDLEVSATEELRKELSRTGEFIIDPTGKKMFGSSKEVYSGGGIKLVQLSRKAKIEGINFVIFGRIIDARIREKTDEIGLVRETKSYSEAKVEIRIFDINSNKEIFTETLMGHSDDKSFQFFADKREEHLAFRRNLMRYSVRIAVRRSIMKILDISTKLDWVGRVARIIGNKIYINAGRKSGLQIGDILKVITEGSEIFDPETGALLGVSKGEIKGTVEIIDYFGPDGSVAILHSGGSVVEGDFVQLY